MSLASTSQDHAGIAPPPITKMPSPIELFSPKRSTSFHRSTAKSDERTALWTADSIHRANNLAQLTTGLGSLASRFPAKFLLSGADVRIKALASAYAKLARPRSDRTPVACRELLRQIATGLTDLFGKPYRIGLRFNGSEIFLPADARRALILIASELVVNSLKYAFPEDRPGTIDVSLWEDGGEGQLAVGDDGVGLVGAGGTGLGSGLVNRLGALFGATVGRSSSEHGHLVWARFPMPSVVETDASRAPDRSYMPDRMTMPAVSC